ncbi:hypothetical protein EVAR_996_1 [Eumeta japonica]|uniref:Uncharacterized protein n=1 Tax=Eumeta variegata TaxID=151549 RepID=A0A4C1SEJ0_EUMVA|nr:hypothetical protein EVAR_996_1 [Eumeta japonica]
MLTSTLHQILLSQINLKKINQYKIENSSFYAHESEAVDYRNTPPHRLELLTGGLVGGQVFPFAQARSPAGVAMLRRRSAEERDQGTHQEPRQHPGEDIIYTY